MSMRAILCAVIVFALHVPSTIPDAQARQQVDRSDDSSSMPLGKSALAALVESSFGILGNSVANLNARGDSLWVGPYLNLTVDGGDTWLIPDNDSLVGTVNRVFSIDTTPGLIVAGLGRQDASGGQSVQTAAGFMISENGGADFDYRFPQLDSPGDDTVIYGVNTLDALPVIVPQQSPPFDVSIDPETGELWVAGWASGIRRSSDQGRTWSRVVLPPDDLDFVHPDSTYDFSLEPQRGGSGSLNHMGFSVLVDRTGSIWAGTAGGLNRSLDGGVTWRKFQFDGSSFSLTGNWVISIEEQVIDEEHTLWMATWNTGDAGGAGGGQFGVTYTRDGGATFKQALLGERIYDFAFDGFTVYAAGENGLFISEDGGFSWRSISTFRDRNDSDRRVRPGAAVFSVAVTNDLLWVGTSDGLVASSDGGETWTLYRTEVPVNPEEPSDVVPDVDAFAYPNPFSPGADRFIRIRYELESASPVTISVFDYGMNPVRTIRDEKPAGVSESIWDGTDSEGARIANGAYFYEIEANGSTFRGKILVIE